MPGSVQSVERAAAVLRTLGAAGRPLELAEVADALGLAKTTVFGLLRTLREVGFVVQHPPETAYSLGDAIARLDAAALDPHDLRSIATNWADGLAAHSRLEVLLVMPEDDGVRVVHHVYRPDGTTQRLRVGELLPLHATASGKVLLASAVRAAGPVTLTRFTSRTVRTRARLEAELASVREAGWAIALAEHAADRAGVAAALRGYGGLVVGAVEATGPTDRVCTPDGRPRRPVVERVRATARAISRAVVEPR